MRVAHELGKFPHEIIETMTMEELELFLGYLSITDEEARRAHA